MRSGIQEYTEQAEKCFEQQCKRNNHSMHQAPQCEKYDDQNASTAAWLVEHMSSMRSQTLNGITEATRDPSALWECSDHAIVQQLLFRMTKIQHRDIWPTKAPFLLLWFSDLLMCPPAPQDNRVLSSQDWISPSRDYETSTSYSHCTSAHDASIPLISRWNESSHWQNNDMTWVCKYAWQLQQCAFGTNRPDTSRNKWAGYYPN